MLDVRDSSLKISSTRVALSKGQVELDEKYVVGNPVQEKNSHPDTPPIFVSQLKIIHECTGKSSEPNLRYFVPC